MHDGRLTRRDALALGALTGAAGLAANALGPAGALAAPRTSAMRVRAGDFGSRMTTPPLRAPARFVLLGLLGADGCAVDLQVRARRARGSWTEWHPLGGHVAHAPERPGRGAAASDPLWTGSADELQLRAARRPRADLRIALVSVPRAALAVVAARAARSRRAHLSQLGARPPIVLRAGWGGDLLPPRERPSYGKIELAVVHHTESANDYTAEQAPGVVLAIAKFHRDTRRWNDVGYNYLVDRFGTIYEGRAGGIDLAVIGAHAQGFNAISTGISVIGSFTSAEPPGPVLDAVARLVAWRLPLAGIPVVGQATVVSGGGSLSRFRAGAEVTLPRICGHRDVGSTACPGDRLHSRLPELRARAQGIAGAPVVRPEVSLGAPTMRVRFGNSARFEGSVLAPDKTPQPGVRVRVEKRGQGGSWIPIASATTDADGAFSASTPWKRAGLVRAAALGAVSLPLNVALSPALEVAPDATAVAAGGVVTLRGRMRPPGTVKVVVQRRSRGRWQRVATVSRKARDGFALPVRLRRPGAHRLLVTAGSTGETASARPISIRVGPATGGAQGV